MKDSTKNISNKCKWNLKKLKNYVKKCKKKIPKWKLNFKMKRISLSWKEINSKFKKSMKVKWRALRDNYLHIKLPRIVHWSKATLLKSQFCNLNWFNWDKRIVYFKKSFFVFLQSLNKINLPFNTGNNNFFPTWIK